MTRPVLAGARARRRTRLLVSITGALLASILGFFAYMAHRLTHPARVPEPVNPSHFLLTSKDVFWGAPDGGQISGWWIPGQEGAPGILLAPGYGMSRSDGLSLAAVLNKDGFNLLTYDARGSGARPTGKSTLGLLEVGDMMAALNFLRATAGVNPNRLGIWGVDVNARAALKAAASIRQIRAVAADSAYDSIADFIGAKLAEDFGWQSRITEFGCLRMFQLLSFSASSALNQRLSVTELLDKDILFIQGENRGEFARCTTALYNRVRPQKELIQLPVSRVRFMSGDEIRDYDSHVRSFFRLCLQ